MKNVKRGAFTNLVDLSWCLEEQRGWRQATKDVQRAKPKSVDGVGQRDARVRRHWISR